MCGTFKLIAPALQQGTEYLTQSAAEKAIFTDLINCSFQVLLNFDGKAN